MKTLAWSYPGSDLKYLVHKRAFYTTNRVAYVNIKHEIVVKKLSLIFQSKHCQTEWRTTFNHIIQNYNSKLSDVALHFVYMIQIRYSAWNYFPSLINTKHILDRANIWGNFTLIHLKKITTNNNIADNKMKRHVAQNFAGGF